MIDLIEMCNHQFIDDEAEDKLILALDVQLQDDIELTDLDKVWISGGNQYSPSKIYVAQLASNIRRTGVFGASLVSMAAGVETKVD